MASGAVMTAGRFLAAEVGTEGESVTSVITKVSDTVLTEDVLSAVFLVGGVGIALTGRERPTLAAGNFVLAFFLAGLVKTSQAEDPDLPQWPYWPLVALLSSLAVVSAVLVCMQEKVMALLTGLALAILGLAVIVVMPLHQPINISDWSVPLAAPVAAGLLILGFAGGLQLVRRPGRRQVLAAALAAVLGGFLATSGALWFMQGDELALELTRAVVSAGRSQDEAEEAAVRARPLVAIWLGLSAAFLLLRLAGLAFWDHCCSPESGKDRSGTYSARDFQGARA